MNPTDSIDAGTTRECLYCHEVKTLAAFVKQPDCKLGVRPKCLDCENIYQREIKYQKRKGTPRYKERLRIGNAVSRAKYPEKDAARRLAYKIPLKPACEKCGGIGKLHRHHPDHAKPLEVITLCIPCHEATHHRGLVL